MTFLIFFVPDGFACWQLSKNYNLNKPDNSYVLNKVKDGDRRTAIRYNAIGQLGL
jgi:hypothetical protein